MTQHLKEIQTIFSQAKKIARFNAGNLSSTSFHRQVAGKNIKFEIKENIKKSCKLKFTPSTELNVLVYTHASIDTKNIK